MVHSVIVLESSRLPGVRYRKLVNSNYRGLDGGEEGIRTLVGLTPPTDFESVPL